jgi:hypothetical protein
MNPKEIEIVDKITSMKYLQPKFKLDKRKIQYNNYYKSYDFWKSKWPNGFENVPHIDLLIHNIKDNYNSTPLEEMEMREIRASER